MLLLRKEGAGTTMEAYVCSDSPASGTENGVVGRREAKRKGAALVQPPYRAQRASRSPGLQAEFVQGPAVRPVACCDVSLGIWRRCGYGPVGFPFLGCLALASSKDRPGRQTDSRTAATHPPQSGRIRHRQSARN